MGFSLSLYPWVYKAQYLGDGQWAESFDKKPHKSPAEEAALSPAELQSLLAQRNSFPELPLVNYTTQYGMGCFEGLKAYPQKDGSLKIFRPDRNAARMYSSMQGLMMPPLPTHLFLNGVKGVVAKNRELGFAPAFDPSWEKSHYVEGSAIYLRPFSYSEPAIGLGISKHPWVVVIGTPVSSYFSSANNKARTTDKVRANPKGTGWIKCDANYVVPTLAKKQAEAEGYMEAVFLDAKEGKYVEEGSSCNIFFLLEDDTLATPELGDTILPGITRDSVLTLARDVGLKTDERRLPLAEMMDRAKECFVTGTAAGVSYIESLTHGTQTKVFGDGKMGPVSTELLRTLKGIQYGAVEDRHGWMVQA